MCSWLGREWVDLGWDYWGEAPLQRGEDTEMGDPRVRREGGVGTKGRTPRPSAAVAWCLQALMTSHLALPPPPKISAGPVDSRQNSECWFSRGSRP